MRPLFSFALLSLAWRPCQAGTCGTIVGENEVTYHEDTAEQPNRSKRAAPMNETLWDKTVPITYTISKNFTTFRQDQIRLALRQMTENTCLTYVENDVSPQMEFIPADYCKTKVGHSPEGPNNRQMIFLATECVSRFGSIQHEVMHSLGFGHTHMRSDRDNFITVKKENMQPTKYENNFRKLTKEEEVDLGVSYDFSSALHYKIYDFTANSLPTIVPHDADYEGSIGIAYTLSYSDYKQINLLYKCGAYENRSACKNGAYPHPRDCDKCACTNFHTGALCETDKIPIKLQPGKPHSIAYQGGKKNRDYTTNDFALFEKADPTVVQAPAGKRIRVRIEKIQEEKCLTNSCEWGAVEVIDNAQADLTIGGKFFCCGDKQGYTFTSQSNVVGFRAYSAPGFQFDTVTTFEIV